MTDKADIHLVVSPAEQALLDHQSFAVSTLNKMTILPDEYDVEALPEGLENCVFVGHKATDLDSIASAIAGVDLFGGIAARASNINSETEWALKRWGFDVPPIFSEVGKGKSVVLVDHNQIKQMADGVSCENVKACIDHHAMQSGTIATSSPIFVLIRPWGSCCTIIADMYVRSSKVFKPEIAGILLSGILSDTLNLRSPTTTIIDRKMSSILARAAKVDDINLISSGLFKAKSSELDKMSAAQLVMGDMKSFVFPVRQGTITQLSVAFGVIEGTDIEGLIKRREELAFELRAFRAENKFDVAFLALVNIDKMYSEVILLSNVEKDLAEHAWPDAKFDPSTKLMNLGNRVSRKKQFIEPLSDALQKGWHISSSIQNRRSLFSTKSVNKAWFHNIAFKGIALDTKHETKQAHDHHSKCDHSDESKSDHESHSDEHADFGELVHICDEVSGCMIVRQPSQ
jgi:inorganic pyrophosphatase/exopolyphosphatase